MENQGLHGLVLPCPNGRPGSNLPSGLPVLCRPASWGLLTEFPLLYNKILLLLLLTVFQDLPLVDVLFSHEIRFHEQRLVDLDIQDMCIDKSLAEKLKRIFKL